MSLMIREPCKTFLMSPDDGAHFSRVPGPGRQWIESPPLAETPTEAFPAPVLSPHTGHTLVILPGHSASRVDTKVVLWTPPTQSIHFWPASEMELIHWPVSGREQGDSANDKGSRIYRVQ